MTEALPLSPSAVAEWVPFAKAAGFFLATFVLEDVAAVGAGLLLATGGISWPAAFAACFLGIWMGDAGLYALARCAGRGWFERSSLRRFTANVKKNFQIIELNGAASEATSIYDARNSIFDAYRTLFRQWDLVFAIGAANRQRGCAPTKLSLVWQRWREYSRLAATYPAAD
jgi:hypothetical protein